jgi:hypothetical protein
VARLAGDPGATGKDRLMLDMSPQVDFLAWNSCFDDFRAISEVFPVNIMAMNGAPVKIPHVLENAQALRAGLLLVYAENQPARNRYEMSGGALRRGPAPPAGVDSRSGGTAQPGVRRY